MLPSVIAGPAGEIEPPGCRSRVRKSTEPNCPHAGQEKLGQGTLAGIGAASFRQGRSEPPGCGVGTPFPRGAQQAMQHPARTPSDACGSVEAIRSRSSLSACGSTWSAAIMARTKGSKRMSGKVRRFGPSWHRLLASGFIVSSRVGTAISNLDR
jgi:hypothetical protein